jgi:hypothetical protein
MKVIKFEDLKCWQEARKLRKVVSKMTRQLDTKKDYIFCDQIRSAALDDEYISEEL